MMACLSLSTNTLNPKVTQFKIGLCQISVTSDKNTNLAAARKSIDSAAKQGAILLLLPEMWNCPYSTDYFAKLAEEFDGGDLSPSLSMLSEAASCHRITIVGGSIPELNNGRLYNTCFVFGPDGSLIAKHRKLHLFDVNNNIPGDVSFRESDTFTAGDVPTFVQTEVGCIGIGICHDLRFPELAMLYRERGAHIICYPGAFNMTTGETLWELEQRASVSGFLIWDGRRSNLTYHLQSGSNSLLFDTWGCLVYSQNFRAADNQLYVATCSPARDSAGSYMIWGHSTLVGPTGQIIATAGHEETTVVAEIDYSAIPCEREPPLVEKQRRGTVYRFVDLQEQRP